MELTCFLCWRRAVEEEATDLSVVNETGCSVAHWATSGDDEAVCRYGLRARHVLKVTIKLLVATMQSASLSRQPEP